MIGDQIPLPTRADLVAEMRDRRYSAAVVALTALVSINKRQLAGEFVPVSERVIAWTMAESAVPKITQAKSPH